MLLLHWASLSPIYLNTCSQSNLLNSIHVGSHAPILALSCWLSSLQCQDNRCQQGQWWVWSVGGRGKISRFSITNPDHSQHV